MKLSIIIPCYNAEKFIERCVYSVLNQQNHNFDVEILLCNDGSKDNTLKVLTKLQRENPNTVFIVDHENQGVYKTRNNALNIVNGDYVWLLDADDVIVADSLRLIEDNLKELPDILSFGYLVEDSKGNFQKILPPEIPSPNDGVNYLKYNDGRLFLWSNIYNLEFLNKNKLRFLGQSMSLEDSFFNTQAFVNAEKVILLKEYIYIYYFNESSISKKPTLENRLKQGESSINVHSALLNFRNKCSRNTSVKVVLNEKLYHSVLGFFFSLLKEKYPVAYIQKVLKLYKEKGLYPIPENVKLNKKANAFKWVVNNKQIFLLLCRINLLRK